MFQEADLEVGEEVHQGEIDQGQGADLEEGVVQDRVVEGVTDREVDHQEEAAQRRATGCILEVITSCKIFKDTCRHHS